MHGHACTHIHTRTRSRSLYAIMSQAPTSGELRWSLNQTMLRIKDPSESIPFYTTWFGMKVIQKKTFSDLSLYFLATVPEGTVVPEPGTDDAEIFLKSGNYGCCLELTHNHGTETMQNFSYHNGNDEPRGFGHIGFLVEDVYGLCGKMVAAGVPFPKKPGEGGMKDIGFAADPDGYWVEIIQRGWQSNTIIRGPPSYHQTMIRVRDLEKSVAFYRDCCHMTEIDRHVFPAWGFSMSFMATISDEEKAKLPAPGTIEAKRALWRFKGTCIELTYNHGTEKDPDFPGYHSGNVEPHRGFGHMAMMVDDLEQACMELESKGVKFQKKPSDGKMKTVAFALDPDGYWVEIATRRTPDQVRIDLAAKEAAVARASSANDSPTMDDDGNRPDRRLTNAMERECEQGPEAILHSGFMFKEGFAFKSWKRRFFVLTRAAIAYYTDQTMTRSQLKGGILLKHINAVKPAESFDTRKPHVLAVETNDRRYLFQASSERERDVWIRQIERAWHRGNPTHTNQTGVEQSLERLAAENAALREQLAHLTRDAPVGAGGLEPESCRIAWTAFQAAIQGKSPDTAAWSFDATARMLVFDMSKKACAELSGMEGAAAFFSNLFVKLDGAEIITHAVEWNATDTQVFWAFEGGSAVPAATATLTFNALRKIATAHLTVTFA
eukprot:m.135009 g.135009  ORF g.135009 m.135009 type:complete len:664 (-) comp11404_c2_seq4:3697-5688(-)